MNQLQNICLLQPYIKHCKHLIFLSEKKDYIIFSSEWVLLRVQVLYPVLKLNDSKPAGQPLHWTNTVPTHLPMFPDPIKPWTLSKLIQCQPGFLSSTVN